MLLRMNPNYQDGVLKNPMTYETMNPELVGLSKNNLVIGKHSGRAALRAKLEEMGYHLSDDESKKVFVKFKSLC